MSFDPLTQGVGGNLVTGAIKYLLVWMTGKFVRYLKRASPYKLVTLCLKHRPYTRDKYEGAFASGQDVLFITVMSQHNLKQMPTLLEKANVNNTRLRVLTWDPNLSTETIDSLRKHLGENPENPERTVEQVKQASQDWDSLASKHSNITVRKYRSSPTMQGLVVGKEWTQIELLPFATHPDYRPALILTATSDPEAFELFRSAFENLWNSAEK